MRKLSLENYTFSVLDQKGINRLVTYRVKKALINVLTHQTLGLTGLDILSIDPVITKIEKATSEVTLSELEYYKLIENAKKFKGFTSNDREFVKRIFNCPEIPDNENKLILHDN